MVCVFLYAFQLTNSNNCTQHTDTATGVRSVMCILQLEPHMQGYDTVTCCVKVPPLEALAILMDLELIFSPVLLFAYCVCVQEEANLMSLHYSSI